MTNHNGAQNNAGMRDNHEPDTSEKHDGTISASEATETGNMRGLQAISIRLHKSLLSNLKTIAAHHQIGYQPMVRDLLTRFAEAEMLMILTEDEKTMRATDPIDVLPLQT